MSLHGRSSVLHGVAGGIVILNSGSWVCQRSSTLEIYDFEYITKLLCLQVLSWDNVKTVSKKQKRVTHSFFVIG